MANDDILTEAVQLIKAGKKDEARSMLETFVRSNPDHVQAWMWKAGTFANDTDKMKVLEECLRHNPGSPQVVQAIAFLKKHMQASQLQQPAMQAADTTESSKESEEISPVRKGAIIAGITFLAVMAILGLYVAWGMYLNRQIDQAFAQQNCEAVVQNASFISFYPKALFASMFTGYDQYGECRIKLDAEQALAARNLGEALTYTQQYLANYPDGTFAASMSEQAPNILFSWSEQLIASRDYSNGIDRLKQLAQTYPTSPAAQGVQDTILQTYLLWTEELTAQQNYAEAEERLNAALSYFEADAARSKPIKQELVNVYVAWGDMLIQLGDLDNGIKHYQMAGEISPGTVEVELLIARAGLQKALAIADTGNFETALAKVREIADAASSENVISEANAAQETILAAYSVSTSEQAMDQMNDAIYLACEGYAPELPIFGRDAENVRFGLTNFYVKLPTYWTAETPSELRYVICVDETDEELETCPYTGGFFLVRMRYVWKVTVRDILDGKQYGSKTFRGSNPAECPAQVSFLTSSATSRSFGNRPAMEEILTWLESRNLRK